MTIDLTSIYFIALTIVIGALLGSWLIGAAVGLGVVVMSSFIQ